MGEGRAILVAPRPEEQPLGSKRRVIGHPRSRYPRGVCRVCLKRPEIPDERYGRCEQCVKAGRIAFRFRLFPARGGAGYTVKAGELSPRALRQKWREPLLAFKGQPSTRAHLGLHELEMVTAKERIEEFTDRSGSRGA